MKDITIEMMREREDYFWSRVIKTDKCWNWDRAAGQGYGQLKINGQGLRAHRVAYFLKTGKVLPSSVDMDHLCRNRLCVRPDHVEPVTHRENVLRGEGTAAKHARKTHCIRGHLLSEDNLVKVKKPNLRRCLKCLSLRQRKYDAQKRANAAIDTMEQNIRAKFNG